MNTKRCLKVQGWRMCKLLSGVSIRLPPRSQGVVAFIWFVSVLDLKFFNTFKKYMADVPLNQNEGCSERSHLSEHSGSQTGECFASAFTVGVRGGHITPVYSCLLGPGRASIGCGQRWGRSWELAPWGPGRAPREGLPPACTPGSLSITLAPRGAQRKPRVLKKALALVGLGPSDARGPQFYPEPLLFPLPSAFVQGCRGKDGEKTGKTFPT